MRSFARRISISAIALFSCSVTQAVLPSLLTVMYSGSTSLVAVRPGATRMPGRLAGKRTVLMPSTCSPLVLELDDRHGAGRIGDFGHG